MKYQKGYNGRLRKVNRVLSRIQVMYNDGTTSNDLWKIFEPIERLCDDVPATSPASIAWHKALSLLQTVARAEYEDEVVTEYWASQ